MSEPRKGIHKLRIPIIDLAVIDVLFTLVVAYVSAKVIDKKDIIKKTILYFIILFIVGEIIHIQLGIKTQFVQYLLK